MSTPTPSAPTEQSGHDGIVPHGNEDILQALTQSSMPGGESNDPGNDNTDDYIQVDGTRKQKLASKVWNHFTRQNIDGVYKAERKYCKKKLSANSKNGTSHLNEHFKRCLCRDTNDIRQCVLSASTGFDGKIQLKNHAFDDELAHLHLAYMIIMHEYPLRMVDHKGFRMFLNTIQPLFKPILRNTLRSDILKIFSEEKSKIMALLESNKSRIAITTDMWISSNQKKGYMAVTAYFIDNSWSLQSRIVRFMYVSCPYNVATISDALFECLMDWNIDSNLSTLTLDNCNTNDSVISMLSIFMNKFSRDSLLLGGKFLHMRCVAHILKLIVKDGMDALGDNIERIRDNVYYWTSTPERVEKFEETARQLHIQCKKKHAHDGKTRWNSNYFMLSTALMYMSVFPHLKQHDSTYKTAPTEHDWLLAREICEKLEFFYDLTNMFSTTKYPTANTIFMYIYEIIIRMNGWCDSTYPEVVFMADSIIQKFNKYWEDIHVVFSIAVILDPRFKFIMFDFYYDKFYGEDSEIEKEKIRKTMYEFEKVYKSESSNAKSSTSGSIFSSSPASKTMMGSGARPFLGGIDSFEAYLSEVATETHEKSEFDSYLEEPLLPRDEDFDILTWWKTQGVKYRTLRSIARDIYAILVSTVASEAAFSTGGRVVTKHCSRLIPETLEALMCSQYWLWVRFEETLSSSSESPSRVANGVTTYTSDDDREEEESVITTIF